MSTQEKIFGVVILLIFSIIIYSTFVSVRKNPTPVPIPKDKISQEEPYRNMFYDDCYNEEGIVVQCKG